MPRHLPALAIMLLASVLGCRNQPVARLSVDPDSIVLRYGRCTPVAFRWTPLAPLKRTKGSPYVFAHLLQGQHNLVRTFDHPLPFPWTPAKQQSYEYLFCQSAMAEPLGAGSYTLKVGLYENPSGYRWPLQTSGVEAGRRGYHVAKVVVPAPDDQSPGVVFSPEWPNAEPSGNKQNPTWRRIPASGVFLLTGLGRARGVRLAFYFPPKSSGEVTVATSCGEASHVVRASGVIVLPIAASSSGSCEIRFGPGTATTVYLESLALVD